MTPARPDLSGPHPQLEAATRSRPLLVGECSPARYVAGGRASPLYPHPPGCAGDRLRRLAGLKAAPYLARFDRLNLLPPSAAERWPVAEAEYMAGNLLRGGLLDGRRVVLLGARVRRAFAAAAAWPRIPDWFEWVTCCPPVPPRAGPLGLVCLPHPSGRSRLWNDEGNCAAGRAALLRALGENA